VGEILGSLGVTFGRERAWNDVMAITGDDKGVDDVMV
jgi:hypothetical protein